MTMPAPRYRIWSMEHAMWWKPEWAGYTDNINEAGVYDRKDAETITLDNYHGSLGLCDVAVMVRP